MASSMIVLIEDNPDDEALTLRALKKNNIKNEVFVARNGLEALDYLFADSSGKENNRSNGPALILLDLKLPKIGGLEVLKRIRAHERTRFSPVIVLTSSNEEQDLFHSYSYGCNSYIRKPVDSDNFVKAIGHLGLYWLVLNQSPPVKV